jgi:tRNA(adenine34) deaminase
MTDESFMAQALAEAEKSLKRGEVPVGAVVILEGRIISRGHNMPISKKDPTAHAEIIAIKKACQKLSNYRLPACDLYVTLEPCAMCMGAAIQARIRRLVFGAQDPKSGAVKSIMDFPIERTNHKMEVKGGVMAEECSRVLKKFFLDKRR